jgi:hypothetical protein
MPEPFGPADVELMQRVLQKISADNNYHEGSLERLKIGAFLINLIDGGRGEDFVSMDTLEAGSPEGAAADDAVWQAYFKYTDPRNSEPRPFL